MLAFRVVLLVILGLLALAPFGESSGKPFYHDQVAVLAYHHISDSAKSNVTITSDLFRRQLTYLQQQGFRFISMAQYRSFLEGGPVPVNAVLVTFDDGYESFYSKAFPILKELHIPAVNFVVTGDLQHPQQTAIPSLSPQDIATIRQESDLYTFQCHSDALHQIAPDKGDQSLLTAFLNKDGKPEDDAAYRTRVTNDTTLCLERLRQTFNGPVDAYAYPFGFTTDEATELIRTAGVRYAFTVTSEMSLRSDDPLRLPRINAGNPSFEPEKLQDMILRRALDLDATFDYVPLRDTVTHIGGMVVTGANGITFYYHGITWVTQAGSDHLTKDGQVIKFSHPLIVRNKKVQIRLDDLERALGIQLQYIDLTKGFRERFTPEVPASGSQA